MSSLVPKGPGAKRRKDAYKMAPKIPAGELLTDSSKKQWVIHTSIGKGGFGEIYTASAAEDKSQKNYVIKVEPSENGPLFVEKNVYIRIGKKEDTPNLSDPQSVSVVLQKMSSGSEYYVLMPMANKKRTKMLLCTVNDLEYEEDRSVKQLDDDIVEDSDWEDFNEEESEIEVFKDTENWADLEFQKAKGLRSFGMPTFYGSGIHLMDGKKYRFLVMERYGKDLWSIFLNHKTFPPATVYKIAIQVLDVLEYIHSKGYVHADIKGANLLLGRSKGNDNQVYLVDYGLAARYSSEYRKDPKKAHNGTIEYISRDGHDGVVTRRGDIEILGYNLLHWLSSALPWEGINDTTEVQKRKNKSLKDCRNFLRSCFKNTCIPSPLEKYFEYVIYMEPLEEPNYSKLKKMMKEGIEASGSNSSKLEFSPGRNIRTKSGNQSSPVPPKIRATHDEMKRRGRSGTSRAKTDETINISESSSNEDDLIETTPERKIVKRSWKDCPSVVSCAELLLKDEKTLRRTRRNK